MKQIGSTHIMGKMLVGLLDAEVVGLTIAIAIAFLITKPRMERNTLEQAVEDGQHLAAEIDRALDSMCQSVEYLCTSPDFEEALTEAEAGNSGMLRAELNGVCRFETLNIRAVAAYSEELGWVLSDGALSETDELAMSSPSMLALNAQNLGPTIANIYSGWSTNDTLSVGMAIISDGGSLWRLVFLFQADELKNTITNSLSYDYEGFEIGRVNGPGFFSSGDSANAHRILAEHTNDGNYTIWDESGLYVITQTNYKWRICGVISQKKFSSFYMPALKNAVLMCLVMFFASLAILLPLTRGMLRPIRTLQRTMIKAATGDLTVQAVIPTRDEFHELGVYFNNMLAQIKAHTDDAIKLEISDQNLRHSLLVSQVNYHFIYNAMSTINSLARRKDCERIIALNSALADILQEDMLVQNGEMTCTLARELSVVENYWRIESISRKGTADLVIDCPDSLRQSVIPRSILQPLVENSLRHGIVDEESGELRGHICVRTTVQDGFLLLSVTDDGRGIEPEILRKLQTEQKIEQGGRHIGIANIRKRLEYLYDGRAKVFVESNPGTTITIKLPMRGRG